MFTKNELQLCLKQASMQHVNEFYAPLVAACNTFEIDSPIRQAAFIAQIGHESGQLAFVREGLNYKAETLIKLWPSHFESMEVALRYEHNPEKIANRAYANRNGNGDEASGDGWKYRGRGLIQITGKNNYVACSDAIAHDCIEDPEYLETPEGAALSAGWYWKMKRINPVADINDIKRMTLLINGGLNGFEDRKDLFEIAKIVLGAR